MDGSNLNIIILLEIIAALLVGGFILILQLRKARQTASLLKSLIRSNRYSPIDSKARWQELVNKQLQLQQHSLNSLALEDHKIPKQVAKLRATFLAAEAAACEKDDHDAVYAAAFDDLFKNLLLQQKSHLASTGEQDWQYKYDIQVKRVEAIKRQLNAKDSEIINQTREALQQACISGEVNLDSLLDKIDDHQQQTSHRVFVESSQTVHFQSSDNQPSSEIDNPFDSSVEAKRLKATCLKQTEIINDLKETLKQKIATDPDLLIKQIETLESNLRETDTCIQVLEGETHELRQQLNSSTQALQSAQSLQVDSQQLQQQLAQFQQDNKQLLSKIGDLSGDRQQQHSKTNFSQQLMQCRRIEDIASLICSTLAEQDLSCYLTIKHNGESSQASNSGPLRRDQLHLLNSIHSSETLIDMGTDHLVNLEFIQVMVCDTNTMGSKRQHSALELAQCICSLANSYIISLEQAAKATSTSAPSVDMSELESQLLSRRHDYSNCIKNLMANIEIALSTMNLNAHDAALFNEIIDEYNQRFAGNDRKFLHCIEQFQALSNSPNQAIKRSA